MNVWNPFEILRSVFADNRRAMVDTARRWRRAFQDQPELQADLIRLGRLVELQPARFEHGEELPEPIDPIRMAYERGQRDMAVKLLAFGKLPQTQMNALMEEPDVY